MTLIKKHLLKYGWVDELTRCHGAKLLDNGNYVVDETSDCYRNITRQHQIPPGPGTELKKLLAELGIEAGPQCKCNARARQMDVWGVEGCKQRRAQIAAALREEDAKLCFKHRMLARFKALKSGTAFRVDLTDVFGWLVDESIRRSE